MTQEQVDLDPRVADPAMVASWADQLQAIARTGLFYSESSYDRERYERILEIAAQMCSRLTGLSVDETIDRWARDVGYVTPKVGVAAAIFDQDALLLLQRPDSGLWSLPVGWSEVGESAAVGVVREVQEETGLLVRPHRVLGIYDGRRHGSDHPHHFYTIIFECRHEAGVPTRTPEALDLGYFRPDNLPPLLPHFRQVIADAFASRGNAWPGPFFDP